MVRRLCDRLPEGLREGVGEAPSSAETGGRIRHLRVAGSACSFWLCGDEGARWPRERT